MRSISAVTADPAVSAARRFRVCAEGSNCWRVAEARRVGFLVDGANYFAALKAALLRARHAITILGWDFDPELVLVSEDGSSPRTLRDILLSLVDARPELTVNILVWEAPVFFRPGQRMAGLFGDMMDAHPRIRLHFDDKVPVGGSHHEKVVCIDDALAFVGGIDLTGRRWDTSTHAADDPRRVNPDGSAYGPVHDIQMAVDGAAAAAVADLACLRWQSVMGEPLPPVPPGSDPWPPELDVRIRDIPVAIARTQPALEGIEPAQECAMLDENALSVARRLIYVEAQYLTRARIADVLERHLLAEDGPEIVLIVRLESKGWIEKFVMGENRDRLLRRLRRADRYGRLRTWYPVVSGEPEQQISVHAKLIIVDDCYIRIGSSNLNNRSVGLDSECDLAIECWERGVDAIRRFRRELLAEHLDATPEAVAAAEDAVGSMIAAVERLNTKPRGLRPFEISTEEGETEPMPGTGVLDPEEPLDLTYVWRSIQSG